MNIKIESILKDFDSLSLEEQETVLEIEKKRLIEKRREFLIEDVKEAEAEYKSGKLRPKSVDDIMKDLEDETESKIKTKESIIDLLNRLPEDSNYEDIIAEIYFKKQVEEGLQQLDNGEYLGHDEVLKRMDKWLK